MEKSQLWISIQLIEKIPRSNYQQKPKRHLSFNIFLKFIFSGIFFAKIDSVIAFKWTAKNNFRYEMKS
ncbi:hypothetical protein BpHYR1_000756 [Brachionus plicatilis]|uniref:Uncharacterized protein n=1 Tax=Brachionus plicatilis TaxID=10195 RepID=A0A3M7S3G5_BRAPC|nr:hypothetical protein BpHYR1_000756 [Brachionus plicatilis]